MRSRTDLIAYEKLKTVRQWAKLGYLPIQDAEGILLWTNNFHQGKSRYYGPDDVEKASEEALQEFFAPEKRRRREQQQRWRQKKQMEKQMEKGWESVQGQWSVCPPLKGIVIDTETTGLNFENDEILQVSIVDLDGNLLFNSYIRPYLKTQWPGAQRINHITPEMVQDAPYLHEVAPRIRGIFRAAELVIGYNTSFDLEFLWPVLKGEPPASRIYDVMLAFAPIFGEWDSKNETYKFQKLSTCADYFGYIPTVEYHNSLGDVMATLYCYEKIMERGEENAE